MKSGIIMYFLTNYWQKPENMDFHPLLELIFIFAIVYVVTEDLDDLRMEGVTTLLPSGSKFNQGRATHPAELQAKVTLNICSRCAR